MSFSTFLWHNNVSALLLLVLLQTPPVHQRLSRVPTNGAYPGIGTATGTTTAPMAAMSTPAPPRSPAPARLTNSPVPTTAASPRPGAATLTMTAETVLTRLTAVSYATLAGAVYM